MARKIRLTRLELKRQREALTRYERYLPTLKLKQQQLQVVIAQVQAERLKATAELEQARERFEPYKAVLADLAGVNLVGLSKPAEVLTGRRNVAGLSVPEFQDVRFPEASYSLFATPPWVDRALADLRQISRRQARLGVLDQQHQMLQRELTRVTQRVNLFEKVNIPRAREAIRRIRIHLGDEMTAAVARAKITKAKLQEVSLPGAAEVEDETTGKTPA